MLIQLFVLLKEKGAETIRQIHRQVLTLILPTFRFENNKSIVASGTATSEGLLTLSSDGKYLMLSGYNAAPGNLVSAPSSSRTVGRVDSSGVVDTSTALTDFSTGNNPRSPIFPLDSR